jgi:cobalt-zinc-cadmium efflux system protein
MKGELEKL